MARSLPKVCPFLVTVDLKLKWPELPRGPNYPALPYVKFSRWEQDYQGRAKVVCKSLTELS